MIELKKDNDGFGIVELKENKILEKYKDLNIECHNFCYPKNTNSIAHFDAISIVDKHWKYLKGQDAI